MPPPPTSTITLRLAPSPRLTAVLAGLHAGAVACALASDLPAAIEGAMVVLVAVSAWASVMLHGLRRAAGSIVLLVLDRHGRWRLVRRDGRVLDADLEPGGFSHPQLMALVFRTGKRRTVALAIVPDMADSDGLRRLRVRLRCERPGEPVC